MVPIIYTCTLNPAIDLFMDVDSLEPYIVNRTKSEDYQANGKTINISIVLKKMGINNTALGFLGGFTGNYIKEELQKFGIITDFIEIEGITRVNAFVRTEKKEFKIVNKGPTISEEKVQEILKKIENIPKGSMLFVSGSLPKGVSDDIYVEIAQISKRNCLKLILDISSKKLLECLSYKPYLIKPNEEELKGFFEKEIVRKEDIIELGTELLKMGAKRVLVSLGEKGSLYLSNKEVLQVSSPKGNVVNTACAGDALLGAFIGKEVLGASLEESLVFASATGASTAFSRGLSNLTDVERLKKEIQLHYLEKLEK